MGALVGDLLELSRIEAGSLQLRFESFSLAETCERAVAPLHPLAGRRGIRLVLDLPALLRTARADRRRTEQIVTNLAGNACKFAPPGGLVEVIGRVEGPVALVIVRDDGPGIARADRERVFRPFARLDGHERTPGTGLGLPISRDLARAMGGEVAVASVPGSGSSFILALPAAAEVSRATVLAALPAAVEAEEVALEERAVLRALRASARTGRHEPDAAQPAGTGHAAGAAQPAAAVPPAAASQPAAAAPRATLPAELDTAEVDAA
jgi:hypothetical protein